VPESRYLIYANDSAMTHDCSARDGGRVEVPVYFTGSGTHSVCPYCLRSV
jgi:hypothetical protein